MASRTLCRALVALAAATLVAPPLFATAAPGTSPGPEPDGPATRGAALAERLVREASAEGALAHLRQLQAIAVEHGGDRAAGTAGYDASAAYVRGLLEGAGYRVREEPFAITYTEPLAERLAVLTPRPRTVTVAAMTYTSSTPPGGLTAPLAAVPADATPGCDRADYAGRDFTGRIALIGRGGCSFADKQAAAADAGAVGAIVHNDGEGVLAGTLGEPSSARIPTGGIGRADGEELAALAARSEVTVSFEIRELQERRTTRNVVADTPVGDPRRTAVLGAHLDSVVGSPGVNDNGSGSAGLLEVALRLAATGERPTHRIRFAWWSAEEIGLLGSRTHVAGLGAAGDPPPALYLNFDMIASPNAVQFVYDGDDSDGVGAGPGPAGSAGLERHLTDFLDRIGRPHRALDLDGRSDYGPFLAAGVPSGGAGTGAEGIKSAAEASVFGGVAGRPYHPCYHLACDTLDGIDARSLEQNIDVMAHAVGTFAHDLRVPDEPPGGAAGS